MISLIMYEPSSKKVGDFKSYKAIGEYLAGCGESGKYYAIPKNIKSIAGMREITVVNHGYSKDDDILDIEVCMEGSYF